MTWFAERSSVAARTDEDAAMARIHRGPFDAQHDAIDALIDIILKEYVFKWREGWGHDREREALRMICRGHNEVITDGIRWRVYSI